MWSGFGSGVGGGLKTAFVRHFSRKCAVNLRKINPRVPYQEATSIAENLYGVIKQHGPLNIGNTWTHAKEAGIDGLSSKTHMKLMLKWMRGRNMLKLLCNRVGSNKRFSHCTLPEEPRSEVSDDLVEVKQQTKKKSTKKKSSKKKKK